MATARHAWGIVLLGLLLHAPSLFAGFWVDDYLLLLRLEGDLPGAPWRLFDFGVFSDWDGLDSPVGALPWWTSEDWTARFLRPLASGALALQHRVFGLAPVGYHLTSLALFAAVLVLAMRVFAALGLGDRAARLATLLLAVSKTGAFPVGWIANQSTLLETLFTLGALLAVATPEARRATGHVARGVALAACATLSKESGVCALLLVAGLCWRDRRGAALAAAALVVVYAAAFLGLGYGTNNQLYASPVDAPGRFLGRLLSLVPYSATALFTPLMTDAQTFVPGMRAPLLVVGGVTLAVVVPLLWRHPRAHPAAPLLLAWWTLSAAPQAGAPMSDRLLLGAAPPALALLALAVTGMRSAWARGLVLAGPGVGSAAMLLLVGVNNVTLSEGLRAAALQAPVGAPGPDLRQVVLLQAQNSLVPFSFATTYAIERPGDRGLVVHPVQMGRLGLRWTRVDERTIELEAVGGALLGHPFEQVYRSSVSPPAPGSVHRRGGLEVTVLETAGSGVERLRVRLPYPLEDERIRFLVADGPRLVRVAAPALGQTLEVPEAVPPHPFVP